MQTQLRNPACVLLCQQISGDELFGVADADEFDPVTLRVCRMTWIALDRRQTACCYMMKLASRRLDLKSRLYASCRLALVVSAAELMVIRRR